MASPQDEELQALNHYKKASRAYAMAVSELAQLRGAAFTKQLKVVDEAHAANEAARRAVDTLRKKRKG